MESLIPRAYWPYDEIIASRGQSPHQFCFSSPWLTARIDVHENQAAQVDFVVRKMMDGALTVEDLPAVSWLFGALAEYPLAYRLPAAQFPEGFQSPAVQNDGFATHDPRSTLLALISDDSEAEVAIREVSHRPVFDGDWKWDHEASLALSATSGGHDPVTLFSVARRFHLLDSVENNRTGQLYEFIRTLHGDVARFRGASALVVRQNHFVTQKCDEALRPALATAGDAEEAVLAFIEAEAGHDSIMSRAIEAMGVDPAQVPVIAPVRALMDLFASVGRRNFLAFAMVVDYFERSSYQEHDPLAEMLVGGGQVQAAKFVDVHKDINDAGGHENAALAFLASMGPVAPDYAMEALKLAEVVTNTMHLVSAVLLEKIDNQGV